MSETQRPSWLQRSSAAWPWILVACGGLAYANSFAVPFLFDDIPTIVENRDIRHLWPFWHLLYYTGNVDTGISGRPIANVSFAISHAFGGLSVAGYHAFNLAIHVGSALLVYGLVRRTLRVSRFQERFASSADAIGFAIALLWLVHPLQTKSVTFIVQRIESLAAFFYLLTLYALLRGATAASSKRWFQLAVLACLLGMGTKEIVVGAPIAAFLFDATFLAGSWREAVRVRGKLHALLASTWIVLIVLVLTTARIRVASEAASVVTPFEYLTTQCWAIAHYLRLVLWPSPLVFDYGMAGDGVPLVTEPAQIAMYAIPLALAFLCTVWGALKRRPWAFVAAIFFLVLAPSSSIVPIRQDVVAEHRMYLPLVSVLTLAVFAVVTGLDRVGRAALVAPAAMLVAIPLGWMTHERNRDYASEHTIWADTVAKRPKSARAQTNLGLALFAEGDVEGALAHHREAVRLRPDYSQAHHNLAAAMMHQQAFADAAVEYRQALALAPSAWESHLGLAEALLAQEEIEPAAKEFIEALRRNPELPDAYVRLAAIRQTQQRWSESADAYERALHWKQDDAGLFNQLGIVNAERGRFDQAANCFQRALQIQPTFEDARANLEHLKSMVPGR